ncbi:diflavin oxidoreductase [Rhodovibrio salinarum]|uniref:assimilatory sulfite reductase (NADPH) n=1 Tax=Rhodovibrio salinarum TaxID=1087 RepID=A0A934V2Z7_9PROT|nr:sulfite reductase flavoprotein subunit alpha [Rhodovibrio salinarum]MBK1699014.1 sulfite reductase subunit alpha [Rhodovibrio salinarum]
MTADQLPLSRALPSDAPFTPSQRAWLEGFLAGFMSPQAGATAPQEQSAKAGLQVLFASQTGTAESVAKKLAKAAKADGRPAQAVDIEDMDLDTLAQAERIAVIASTTGEGEAPDSAKGLIKALEQADSGALSGMSYAVLALGDSNYEQFCAFGRYLDETFQALGATPLVERVDVDGNPDAPMAEFRSGLLEALQEHDGMADTAAGALPTTATATLDDGDDEDRWTRAHPFQATLIANTRLNPESDKETRHIELALGRNGPTYEPGDALGVVAPNDPELVQAVLAEAGLDGSEEVSAAKGTTARLDEVLTHRAVITELAPATVRKFQERADSQDLARLLADDAGDELTAWLYGRDLLDLLRAHPGVIERGEDLASLLPTLQPRLYSIASSPRAHPEEVHLTVGIVRYDACGRSKAGVTTGHLADRLQPGDTVGVYRSPNKRFSLPEDPDTPVIMIGPGTGIAPFRAFLEERQATRAGGANWLFFGERREACDYLYRRELEAFHRAGLLTRLDTAFSRDGAEKLYVQHQLARNGQEIWRWLQAGAHLFVCGDAKHMARDVEAALVDLIAAHGAMGADAAREHLDELIAHKRYKKDVY